MADLWKLPGVSADAKKKPVDPKKRAVQAVKMASSNVKSNLKKSTRTQAKGKYDLEGKPAPKGTNKMGISQAREGLAEATSAADKAGVKGSKIKRLTRGTGKVRAQKPMGIATRILGSTGKQEAKSDARMYGKVEKPGSEKVSGTGSMAAYDASASRARKAGSGVIKDKLVSSKKAAKWDVATKKDEAKQIKGYDKAASKAVRSGKATYK
jgi:hypothetical protein